MNNIFIFTAGDPAARAHLDDSITNSILPDKIFNTFEPIYHDQLQAIYKEGEGFFAWGAVPGPQNVPRWEAMQKGDYALCVHDSTYQYIAKVIDKFNNNVAASEIWGTDPNGNTWQYMYFLTKPVKVHIPVRDLAQYLNSAYMGFAKISGQRIQNIIQQFQSVDNFVKQIIYKESETLNIPTKQSEDVMNNVLTYVHNKGFHFEPWQIATYITALKTKPFVILAGVSGTGKSKLPALVAEATGGISTLVPVHPDWTDSAEVIGYKNLQGVFQPGHLMQFINETRKQENKNIHHVCIIDEMNLARVEHYFAEVLSRIEDRRKSADDGYESGPLVCGEIDEPWRNLGLPANLSIVGTVNMDESTHGLSKKVLDRAFTLELSDIDLTIRTTTMPPVDPVSWSLADWQPRAIRLGELEVLSLDEETMIDKVITTLTEINSILRQAQLQVGYRTRDEVALFVLHAQAYKGSFKTSSGKTVDPLDLALLMKILPRISGGSMPIRNAVLELLGWSNNGQKILSEQDAEPLLDSWKSGGQPESYEGAHYPRMTARLCLMWDRLKNEGFTSFWL